MLLRSRINGFLNRAYRSRASIFIPGQGEIEVGNNIFGILERPDGRILLATHNIVTDAGDIYYAQRSAGAAPTNTFGTHFQASAAVAGHPSKASTYGNFTVIAGSLVANDATYPQANNTDADNDGKGAKVVTNKVSYSRPSFNAATVTHGGITIAAPVSGSPLLNAYLWAAAFSKTEDDTLTVYVNHGMLGI